jgi:hypothetical protein
MRDRVQNTNDKRFIFSAYTNSVGAVIHQPVKAFLSDAPCAAIPVTGGLISQSREKISFGVGAQEILRVGRASATVLGERRGDHYVTLATTTVEDLNILDIIKADALVSRVTAVFPADGKRLEGCGANDHKALFHLTGSRFENLKIDQELIDCKLNPEFPKKDDDFFTRGKDGGFFIKECGAQHASLFAAGCQSKPIAQFGTIRLGQVDATGGKVTLTLLEVKLGCPFVGVVAAAGSGSNGGDG